MNIMERVSGLYEECGMDMFSDISTYLTYGYMHKTPTSFILAKTVDKDSDTPPAEQWGTLKPNAWFVHMAVGEECVKHWINLMPFKLPYVGWARQNKKRPIKFYDLNKISRRK
jgi:hypothetical protein